MWLKDSPFIREREVNDAARRKRSLHFGQVMKLCRSVAYMLDDVIAYYDVEVFVFKGEACVLYLLKAISIKDCSAVGYIYGI